MTNDRAIQLLMELEDLAVLVCVQEARLPGDRDVAALKRDVQDRRDRIIEYLAACRAADLADETIH